MRQTPSPSPVCRIAAAVLIAGLLSPAPGFAAEGEKKAEGQEPPVPVEKQWYDPLMRATDQGVDLIVIRPLGLITWGAGLALFVPAVILTAPNGTESIGDAFDRFVREP